MKNMKNTINMKPYIKGIILAVGMLLIISPDANAQFGKKLGDLKGKLGGKLGGVLPKKNDWEQRGRF